MLWPEERIWYEEMSQRDIEWFLRLRRREKEVAVIKKSHEEQIRRDMEELEELKNDLLWEARAKRLLTSEGWAKYSARKNILVHG